MFQKVIRKISGEKVESHEIDTLILNEAVNFEKKTIFIAVPKTGTTSVRKQLRQEGKAIVENPHLDILQIRDSLYVYFLKIALGNNRTFPSSSVPTNKEVHIRADETFRTFFKFSAVRNPWARAVSLYHRREGVLMSEQLSFDDFCKKHFYASDTCFHPTLHKNQLDWLCDDEENLLMDYVYKLENFDDAITEIAERTDGRIQLVNRRANSNPNSLASKYRELYTEETRRIIAQRFEKDIEYFKYTF